MKLFLKFALRNWKKMIGLRIRFKAETFDPKGILFKCILILEFIFKIEDVRSIEIPMSIFET